MRVEWTEALESGVPSIDDDHRRLLELLDLLGQARGRGLDAVLVKEIIRDLLEFFKAHFEREELVMAEVSYGGLGEHRLDHRLMITSLGEVVAGIAENDLPVDESTMEFLVGWISGHLEHADKPLVADIRRLREDAP